MTNFYRYFKENMEGLGLPAPETLFGSLQSAVAHASLLLAQVEKFGKTVTIGELIGAGTRLEQLGVVSACYASFYVGAVIGSIAVAAGRSLADGRSLSDVLLTAERYGLNRDWLPEILMRRPEIYRPARRAHNGHPPPASA
jgi:hypothetical protein